RVDAAAARAVVAVVLQTRGESWLLPDEVARLLSAAGVNLPVQQIAAEGIEVIVSVVDDPTFGPLIGFGLGGTVVEVLKDTVFRITPLTDADAREMVRSIRGLPLLQGYRGQPLADLEAIEDLLLRISWLVEELPEIAEMDLKPVKVFEPGRGLAPIDVRVSVRR